MSSFPPSGWNVRFLKDMDSLEASSYEEAEISMEALLAVQPSEGEEGAFRFVLAGPDSIKLNVQVTDILREDCFADMSIRAQMDIGQQLILEKNSVCTNWIDIVELVNSQDVEIVNDQDEDVSEQFMEALTKYKKQAPAEKSGSISV